MMRWDYVVTSLLVLMLVSGCGSDNDPGAENSNGSDSFPLEDVAVDTMSDSADFTVVRPGLAYTCAVWQRDRPHSVASTSKVLVSPVGLPPATAEPTIEGGFPIDEAQWMDDRNGALLKGTASCNIASAPSATWAVRIFTGNGRSI